jgi:hypothetical protein
MKIITSPTVEPVCNWPSLFSWERGTDPWHPSAFPAEFQDRIPQEYEGGPKEGWFGLDAWGNEILFVLDGTEIEVKEC